MHIHNCTLKPLYFCDYKVLSDNYMYIDTSAVVKFSYDDTTYTLVKKEGQWCIYDIDTFKQCTLVTNMFQPILTITDVGFSKPKFSCDNPIIKAIGRSWYYPGEFEIDDKIYKKVDDVYHKYTDAEIKVISLEKDLATVKKREEELERRYKDIKNLYIRLYKNTKKKVGVSKKYKLRY